MPPGSRNTSASSMTPNDPCAMAAVEAAETALQRPAPVGLLAGAGRFPVAFAEKMRRLGLPLVTVGIRDHADAELAHLSDRFYWTGLAKVGRVIRLFKREGVRSWVMAGKVQKTRFIGAPWRVVRLFPDWPGPPARVPPRGAP